MSPDETDATSRAGDGVPRILRRELFLFAALFLAAAVLLPPAIYHTGKLLLGEYSREGHGLLHLYGQLYGDLLRGMPAAWLLLLGPWLGVMLVRLLWQPLRRTRRSGGTGDRPAET